MNEQDTRRQAAYRVYADVRMLLDRMPEDHPATPLITQAATQADLYWRKLYTNGGLPPEAGQFRPHVETDARDAPA